MKEEIKTSVEHTFVNIVDICRKTYERNGIEKIVGTGAILWLNEKHIVEGSDHKNMWEITITYHSNRKTDKYDKLMKIDTATEVLTTK